MCGPTTQTPKGSLVMTEAQIKALMRQTAIVTEALAHATKELSGTPPLSAHRARVMDECQSMAADIKNSLDSLEIWAIRRRA